MGYGLVVLLQYVVFVFFKQKTAYEMRISDWSSDVCSSDLQEVAQVAHDVLARAADRDPFAARADYIGQGGVFIELGAHLVEIGDGHIGTQACRAGIGCEFAQNEDRKSTRLNSSH